MGKNINPLDSQVKSKQRVAAHGEVFTSAREVNAMLDLVKQEADRIESRFLEPACGTGNFLDEILRRKLETVTKRYGKSQAEWEKNAIIATASIYGVDILPDNIEHCIARLLGRIAEEYPLKFRTGMKPGFLRSVKFILHRNILWGDALTLKTPKTDDKDEEPIIFSEWALADNNGIQRRDFTFANLLEDDLQQFNAKKYKENEIPLFSDEGDPAFLPKAIANYPLTHYLKLGEDDTDKL